MLELRRIESTPRNTMDSIQQYNFIGFSRFFAHYFLFIARIVEFLIRGL